MDKSKRYRPSNGSEGCAFMATFCEQCIHEKFMHTQNDGDRQCDILNRSMIHNITDPEYPDEWTTDQEGAPTCTGYKHHDWEFDANGEIIDAEEETDDPNQLDLFSDV